MTGEKTNIENKNSKFLDLLGLEGTNRADYTKRNNEAREGKRQNKIIKYKKRQIEIIRNLYLLTLFNDFCYLNCASIKVKK